MVTSGENARKVTEQCKFPCVVYKKGVGSNSMPSEAKERLHSTCVGRAMLHASATWRLNEEDAIRLERTDKKWLDGCAVLGMKIEFQLRNPGLVQN